MTSPVRFLQCTPAKEAQCCSMQNDKYHPQETVIAAMVALLPKREKGNKGILNGIFYHDRVQIIQLILPNNY